MAVSSSYDILDCRLKALSGFFRSLMTLSEILYVKEDIDTRT